MNWCQEIVDHYLCFYRPQAKQGKGFSSAGCIKPLARAQAILMQQTRASNDELALMIAADLKKLMNQIHNGTAEGHWVLSGEAETSAITEFARFFVQEFWVTGLNQDRARISGNKLALIANTCEFIVRGVTK